MNSELFKMIELKMFCVYCRGESENKSYHENCLNLVMDLSAENLSTIEFRNSFPAKRESYKNGIFADIFDLDTRYKYCDYCGKRRMSKSIITYPCGHNFCNISTRKSCKVIELFFDENCIFDLKIKTFT